MKPNPLTMKRAEEIARQMGVAGIRICRSEVDRDLWQVETPGRLEAHEPMDEPTWREFIAASGWIEDSADVPENDESELLEAIREQLSPEAVASIVSHLQGARTNNQDVDRQVRWFADELVKLIGGDEQQARLAEELGL